MDNPFIEYSYKGWQFIIDESKSDRYYSEKPVIFDTIHDYLPELSDFLLHIGVDIKKPYLFKNDDTTDLCYYAFGKAISEQGYELDFYGENKFVSAVILKDRTETERFIVELFGVQIENPIEKT